MCSGHLVPDSPNGIAQGHGLVYDGAASKLYIIGGVVSGTPKDFTEVLDLTGDPNSWAWQPRDNLNTAREHPGQQCKRSCEKYVYLHTMFPTKEWNCTEARSSPLAGSASRPSRFGKSGLCHLLTAVTLVSTQHMLAGWLPALIVRSIRVRELD